MKCDRETIYERDKKGKRKELLLEKRRRFTKFLGFNSGCITALLLVYALEKDFTLKTLLIKYLEMIQNKLGNLDHAHYRGKYI